MMSLAFTELLILDDFSLKERQGNGYPIVHLIILLIVSAYYPTKKTTKIPNLCCNLLAPHYRVASDSKFGLTCHTILVSYSVCVSGSIADSITIS